MFFAAHMTPKFPSKSKTYNFLKYESQITISSRFQQEKN